MKKKVLVVLAFLYIISLLGCVEADGMSYKKLAETINDASDFGGYRLLDEYPGTLKNYDPEYPEEVEVLDDEGRMELSGTYFFFPEEEGSVCLTFINIESDKYNILGVRPGDTLEEAVRLFEEFGFVENVEQREKYGQQIRDVSKVDPYYFANGWAHITISTDLSDAQILTGLQVGFIDPTERDYVL